MKTGRNNRDRCGAAMVEAAVLMSVMMVMLLGGYYAWRMSRVAMEAKVALRCEVMMHSMAVNADSNLNSPSWTYADAGFSDSPDFYCDIGMFEDAAGGVGALGDEETDPKNKVHLTHGQLQLFDAEQTWDVYDAMKDVLVGAASVNITVELPPIPLVNFVEGNAAPDTKVAAKNYSQTVVCSVNPWALHGTQAFRATREWIDGMVSAGAKLEDPPNLLDGVRGIEDLPMKRGSW